MKNNYADIMYMQYKKSTSRSHMSIYDRAAQFSPFAALTGHDKAVGETARLTDKKIILDDEVKTHLSIKLNYINEHLDNQSEIYIEYFLPDSLKNGGMYITAIGKIKKIDEFTHEVIFQNGTIIPIIDIVNIEGDMFNHLI